MTCTLRHPPPSIALLKAINPSLPCKYNQLYHNHHMAEGEKKDLENKMKIKYDLKSNFLSFQRCRDNLS